MKHILSPGEKRRLARDHRIIQRRREGLAPVCKKRVAEAKQVIPLRLEGRTWPEIDAALGFRTISVMEWLKENRGAFDLTEAEWRRVFPGSGRRRLPF